MSWRPCWIPAPGAPDGSRCLRPLPLRAPATLLPGTPVPCRNQRRLPPVRPFVTAASREPSAQPGLPGLIFLSARAAVLVLAGVVFGGRCAGRTRFYLMQLPSFIGKYELIEFLGGGMSQVYRGRDTVIDRPVVVKILTVEASGRSRGEGALSSGGSRGGQYPARKYRQRVRFRRTRGTAVHRDGVSEGRGSAGRASRRALYGRR